MTNKKYTPDKCPCRKWTSNETPNDMPSGPINRQHHPNCRIVDTDQESLAKLKEIFGDIVVGFSDFKFVSKNSADTGVSLYTEPTDVIEQPDGITIEFTNGKKVRFSTSEWAFIQTRRI